MSSQSGQSLDVAVVGLGGIGCRSLDALVDLDGVRVVGVADSNAQRAEQIGRDYGLPHFTDNRQLILNTRPQAAFLAIPPMHAGELLEICAAQGVHVWKEAPLGRSLSEAAGFVRRFEEAGLKIAVGTQRRFSDPYRHARELINRIGEAFLGRAHYLFNWGPQLQWRADRHSAGGGALLEVGYHMIDLLIWLLGLPEEVYGVTAVENPRLAAPDQPPHDTDDSASAILRYADEVMASLVTSRISGPVSEGLALHGRGGSLNVSAEACVLRDPNGDVLDHLRDNFAAQEVFRRQAERFVRSVAEQEPFCPCNGRENLLTHAVIDAIYLSSQTCQPESPHRQLQINGLSAKDCLSPGSKV
jgi:predicted dehydrogenase